MITGQELFAMTRSGDRALATLVAWPVRGYRLLLSPWLGSACRFTPSCSSYALQALETHGGVHGSYLTTRRVLRCHPWCAGGLDPVPPGSSTHPLFDPSRERSRDPTSRPTTPQPAPLHEAAVSNNLPAHTP